MFRLKMIYLGSYVIILHYQQLNASIKVTSNDNFIFKSQYLMQVVRLESAESTRHDTVQH